MADARPVDWAAIRLDWETSGVSDLVLAERWGFRSANTILRKRKLDGWTRSQAVVKASQVKRALEAPYADARASVCVREEAHTHTQPQQNGASGTDNGLGVCVGEGGGGHRAAAAPATAVENRPHTLSPTQEIEAGFLRDLDRIRVEAIRRQLATADKLRRTGEAIADAIYVVFCDGAHGESDAYRYMMALQKLKAVNPDKDTTTSLAKSAATMCDTAAKMERAALGMDAPTGKAADGSDATPVGVRPEDVLSMLSQMSLEDYGNAARKATLMRPMLEGRAETVSTR